MWFKRLNIMLAALSALTASAVRAQNETPANGPVLWIRFPGTSAQEFTSSSAASPRFALGVRRGRVQLGAGIGHVSLRTTDRNTFDFTLPGGSVVPRTTEDEFTATLFQIGPIVLVDVWRSGDRRTRLNVGGGVSIGRLSAVDRNEYVEFPSGNIQSIEDKTTGNLLGFHASLGGDHFLHPNFAIGAETGYQGTAALDIEEDPPAGDRVGAGAGGTYVALRVTVVF